MGALPVKLETDVEPNLMLSRNLKHVVDVLQIFWDCTQLHIRQESWHS